MGYFVEVESGVGLHIEDTGSGTPVVFVHGWPVDHRMFEYQTSWLPGYGYRCVQIDLRGFGASDRPWHGYTYDRLADDLRAVFDMLGLEGVRLIGFSMGGAIATRYVSRHAGYRVAQLILLGAAVPSAARRPGFPYGLPPAEFDKLIAQTYADRPSMLESFGGQFFHRPVSGPFRQWFNSLGLPASAHATAATAGLLRDEDLRGDLPHIRVPTTILHGVHDNIVPFPLALVQQQGIPGSRLIRLEHSGHGLFYDERDTVNRHLLEALGSVPPLGH